VAFKLPEKSFDICPLMPKIIPNKSLRMTPAEFRKTRKSIFPRANLFSQNSTEKYWPDYLSFQSSENTLAIRCFDCLLSLKYAHNLHNQLRVHPGYYSEFLISIISSNYLLTANHLRLRQNHSLKIYFCPSLN
jgi:hypothetical protein